MNSVEGLKADCLGRAGLVYEHVLVSWGFVVGLQGTSGGEQVFFSGFVAVFWLCLWVALWWGYLNVCVNRIYCFLITFLDYGEAM